MEEAPHSLCSHVGAHVTFGEAPSRREEKRRRRRGEGKEEKEEEEEEEGEGTGIVVNKVAR